MVLLLVLSVSDFEEVFGKRGTEIAHMRARRSFQSIS
jgi:hypothetical protein